MPLLRPEDAKQVRPAVHLCMTHVDEARAISPPRWRAAAAPCVPSLVGLGLCQLGHGGLRSVSACWPKWAGVWDSAHEAVKFFPSFDLI
jgi:hypothetical protein